MAILLAMLSTVSIATGEFFAAGVAKRAKANEVTSMMFVAGVVLTAFVAVFWPGDPTGRDLLFGGLAGVTNGVGILLLYVAYSRGSLRSAAPVAAVVMSGMPIAWDVLISDASLSGTTWTGILLGVAAIALSSYAPGESDADRFALPIAILAGAVFGVLLILLGEIGDGAGGMPLFVQRTMALCVAVSVTWLTGPRIFPADRSDRLVSFAVGLFAATAVILFVLAIQAGGSLSAVSVIGSQYAGVAVLLGVALRGQRMWWWQGVGLAGASLSVALITLG
jgi:drug/metabolite transporter (DMT)-like permease